MPRPSPPRRRSGCPISIALDLLGDAWSLLIVRDLMFKDLHTYRDFLDAGEGIASNILADRLLRLEAANVIEKQSDPSDARRFVYRLTKNGIELAPVLVELVLWSAAHDVTDAPAPVLRAMRSDRAAFIADLRRRWKSGKNAAARPSKR